MPVIGIELYPASLVLTKGRDFKWTFENVDEAGAPINYPAGKLYFELADTSKTEWQFTIAGTQASLKVDSVAVDLIPAGTQWQLVFLPDGEAAGGDPIAQGTVRVQG